MKRLSRLFIKRSILSMSISLCLSTHVAATTKSTTSSASENRPNIIFIMTDDHTKQAMSAYNSKLIQTPNLDRLANEGIRFDNSFVTNSICAPSRAVALTGKYSHINGLRDNRDEFDGSQLTFPKLLQQAGYHTAMIGKWHLKTDPTGFEIWKILPGQGVYYNPEFINQDGKTVQHEGYVTTLITDFAIDVIRKRDKTKPLALMYFHKAPHRNWMPDIKDLGLYKNQDFPLPKTFFDDYKTRSRAAYEQDMRIEDLYYSFDMKMHLPKGAKEASGGNAEYDALAEWHSVYSSLTQGQKKAWDAAYDPENEAFNKVNLSGKALAIWKYQRYIKDYLRTVKSIDDNVGRLLDYLDKEGLSNNTLIIYTSDQGFYLGEHGWYDKRFMYEESLGMPLAIRYPKEIPAGLTANELVLNLDIAPTLLDYAGVKVPKEMQGRSLRPVISSQSTPNKKEQPWRSSIYYHYYEYPHGWHLVHAHRGVRTKTHKLIHFYDIDEWELYDLERDPDEVNNVYNQRQYKKMQKKLKTELKRLRQEYQDTGELPKNQT